MKKNKLEQEEQDILDAYESGEFKSVSSTSDWNFFKDVARNTLRKDKRVNIRMTERDLRQFKVKALEEGIPYQTLISSVLHKYLAKGNH